MLWADRGNMLIRSAEVYIATILTWVYVMHMASVGGGANVTDCNNKDNSTDDVYWCDKKSLPLRCCLADGAELKDISWYQKRVGKQVWVDLMEVDDPLVVFERNHKVLLLKRVIVNYTDGLYKCSVNESGDVRSRTFNLTVRVCPPARMDAPGVTEPLDGTLVHVPRSGSLNVTCQGVFGARDNQLNRDGVSVTWVKVDQSDRLRHQEGREDTQTVGSVLMLTNVTSDDYGAYMCILRNKWGVTNTSIVIKAPAFVLEPSLTIGLSILGCLVFIFIVTAAATYYWRLDILLFYKDRCRRLPIEEGRTFDALVVYSQSSQLDRGFVMDACRRELEVNHNYTLCLSSRDFLIGDLVLRNYERSLDASQCVLAVVSPDFMADPFCLYITDQVIAHERRHLIFLTLRPLAAKTANRQRERIQGAMRVGSNVSWPAKESRRKLESFWKRLRYQLPTPIASLQDGRKIANGEAARTEVDDARV